MFFSEGQENLHKSDMFVLDYEIMIVHAALSTLYSTFYLYI